MAAIQVLVIIRVRYFAMLHLEGSSPNLDSESAEK